GILAFFFLTSFRSSVEMNWTILSYPTFFIVIILADIPSRVLRYTKISLLLLNAVLIGLMFNKIYPHGKIFEPFFFQSEKRAVEQFKPLYGINYQIASSLWYFSKQKVLKIPKASRYDFFDTLPIDYARFPKVFYVFKEKNNEYPQWLIDLKPKFKVVKKLERNYLIEKVVLQ
ncbi:MAG: hypothetical protein KDD45_13740, partial [Bdellovibrionales bacterium]|nr:hypothetical protein [Bdellovibrionales bacterium]